MNELTPTRIANLAEDLRELLGYVPPSLTPQRTDAADLRAALSCTETLPDTFRTLATRLRALAEDSEHPCTPELPCPCTARSVVRALEKLCADCNLRFVKAAEQRYQVCYISLISSCQTTRHDANVKQSYRTR